MCQQVYDPVGSSLRRSAIFAVPVAKQAGLDSTLLAAANSSGGVLAKMISAQNLAELFRRVLGWSLLLLLLMCVLVYLQSTPVLSWMVV
jgi:lactate permease